MFDWHIARVLQRGLMDKWHLWGNYMKAHSARLSVVERARRPLRAEWNHRGRASHCKPACVCSSTYFQHIYQLLLYVPLHSLLAMCMNSISKSAILSLRVSGLTLLGTNVMLPPPLQPILDEACRAVEQPWNQWFLIRWWICKKSSYRLAAAQSPFLFSAPASLHYCFSWCAVGERGQPHPSAEWHSMRRRKGEEKSCLVLPLMSKSMHLSLKRWEREKEREAIGTPRTRPKHSHRGSYHMLWIGAFFNLAQQYISPEPLIGQSCN